MSRRFIVVGTMGTGKTTLARQLARTLGIPHVELDQFFWGPDWEECEPERFRQLASDALGGEDWVVDGNHAAVRDLAWGRGTTLIWLDYHPMLVMYRLLRRTVARMLFRTALWHGNRERLGNVFERDSLIFWVFKHHREKRREYPSLLERPEYAHLRLVRLRSPRAAQRWIEGRRQSQPVHTILHLTDYGSPYSGNFVASLRSLDVALRERGWRQVLVFPGRAGARDWFRQLVATGECVYLIPEEDSFLRCTLRIWRTLRRTEADILHVHFSRWDLQAWLAALLTRLDGRRIFLIWHDHGGTLPPPRSPRRAIKDLVKHRLMGRWAVSLPVSNTLARDLVERGFPANRVRTVPNGVDLERATRAGSSRDAVRAQAGTARDTEVFLLFGWDPYRKGVDLAVSAMESIAPGHPNLALWCVGGPGMEGFLHERGIDTGAPWLRLLPRSDDVAALYGAADVFLAPSREEGMPYSVAEAMANGLLVVASDIGGHEPYRGAPGVSLVPIDTSEALAAAMGKTVVLTTEQHQELAEANRRCAARYSLAAWTRAMLDAYEWTVGSRTEVESPPEVPAP